MQKTCRDRRSNAPSTIVAGILARFLALFLVHLILQRLYLLDAVKTQLEHCIGQA